MSSLDFQMVHMTLDTSILLDLDQTLFKCELNDDHQIDFCLS